MSTALWIILIVIVLLVLWVIAMYNGLVRGKNRTDEAWSDIDVQLKRRYDLIPNLVETVKGYAAHEKTTFENVVNARNRAMSITDGASSAKGEAENMLSGALKSVFALAEAYPDLKANQNFLELQRELTDTEDKIQAARRFYNGNVRDFNTSLQVFPTNVINGMLNFKAYEFFQVAEDEKAPVQVKF
ncbi:MAG TPA: LemA family protein [Candidatus Nanoarchaeia archaeon]|nr:LemA family protein [Candidatus Nanoarchaeia archaeon]